MYEELIRYRLNMAYEKAASAKLLLDHGQYKDSVSRSYYAIFSALRALLATEEKDFSKHSGVISYFRMKYVKTKIFDKKYSDYLQSAFQERNTSDYGDFFVLSKDEAEEQYLHALELADAVRAYLEGQLGVSFANEEEGE